MESSIDREKVIKGLQIERECVSRDCDRDCGRCDLVQEMDWLLSVYDDAIDLLKEQETVVRCDKCTMRDRTKMCHIWGRDVKDDDYCSYGKWRRRT